jgi:choline dehydrogenase-like flavoprotein
MTSGHQSLAAATGTAGTPQPSATTAEPAPTRPTDVRGQGPQHTSYDVIIVGSGMGGGTLAYALKDSGARVLLIERGDYVPYERQNWDPVEVFGKGRYKNAEKWYDVDGKPFSPGTYYYVGGNTKFYGASLARFRREDFRATEHQDGASPAWFMQYEDLEPYYRRAEQVYRVHGDNNDDPSLPRPDSFPFPAIGHEPPIQRIADKMRKVGFTPSNIPLGIDLRQGGRCIRCKTCDGYPCLVGAKLDADVACIRPALQTGTVELLTNSYVEQVLTDPDGSRASGVKLIRDGVGHEVGARIVVVSCGAVNSAALLLRSGNERHPDGLANSSGQVGRNYMVHNNSVMVAISPWRVNTSIFQKTLYFNDFYTKGTPDHPFPLGHVQLIGKLQAPMLKGSRPEIPNWALAMVARRSTDWWLFTEDLPDPKNRVTLRDGKIIIHWTPNNVRAHEVLTRETRNLLRKVGYPFVFSQRTGIEVNSHQAGTVRAGTDPTTSVLDPDCRAHDVQNLFVVDSSFFPSLPVINPALTIAANAFRVADSIVEQLATPASSAVPAP